MWFIDASRYNNVSQKTGVENYSFHLINELVKLVPDEITLISPRPVNLGVPEVVIPFPRLWTQVRLSFEMFKSQVTSDTSTLLSADKSQVTSDKLKTQNLFIPSHVMPIFHPKNTAITIHDVAFKRFPESYGILSRLYLDWGARFAVRRAAKIIVPSQATKRDLMEFYKADPSKISVVPLGIGEYDRKESGLLKKSGLLSVVHSSYFLFIGRIETKKNIATLIRAFEIFSKSHPCIQLVLAGGAGVGGNEIIRSIQNPNIQVLGYVDDRTKEFLMRNALCFAFPSLYEGFGLPLLEAMRAGIPIIASDIPSSREVAETNALFFVTENVADLAAKMSRMADDPELRKMLIQNHASVLARYSWKRCAEETWKILNSKQ